MSSETPKRQLKIPIGFKLVSMTAFMLVAATVAVVAIATHMFTDDTKNLLFGSVQSFADEMGDHTHSYFSSLVGVVTTITEISNENIDSTRKIFDLAQQFRRNDEVLAVSTWTKGGVAPRVTTYKEGNSPYKSFMATLKPSEQAWAGEIDVQHVTYNSQGLLAFSLPLSVDAGKKVIAAGVALVNPSKLAKIYDKSGEMTAYLVDRKGNVIAHPMQSLVDGGANFADVPIVSEMLKSSANTKEMEYTDKDGQRQAGAFKVVGIAGAGVVTEIAEERVLQPIVRVKYRSSLVAGLMVFLSFGVAFFFSRTLTKPIKALVALTREIARGNFGIQVKPKGRDEITELTKSFGVMATGLAEREKLKETFKKFHSPEIAEAILKGEIKLGGNRQEATVFFSDIRSFTSMSEDATAEEVVDMLNEYMTAMVSEITKYNGVVDKYVGDAIMAVWGVPMAKPDDTWRAVRASIAMRERLAQFNKERMARGKKPINIGMGLHCGELIAGNIGSTEKMEYTVIGDTVNTASRIESLTKEFGTDMLISESVFEKIKDRVVVEPVQAHVKGKSKALTAYKVRGYYDEQGHAVIVETPYSSYEAGHSDKVVHKESA